MRDVQKGRKSWLERLTSPPEGSEDDEQYDERYGEETQTFQPLGPDEGSRPSDEVDQRQDDNRQDQEPGHRPGSLPDPESPPFGSPGPFRGSRVAGAESGQPDNFDAAFTPRGLRTPPSDFRTGPRERFNTMSQPGQATSPLQSGGDAEAPDRFGFRRPQPIPEGEPVWGGEPAETPARTAFGRHGADRPDPNWPDPSRPDADQPDASRPDANRPDANRPDASTPDTDQPDAAAVDADLAGQSQVEAREEGGQDAPDRGLTERPSADRAEPVAPDPASPFRSGDDRGTAVPEASAGEHSGQTPSNDAIPHEPDVSNGSGGSNGHADHAGHRAETDHGAGASDRAAAERPADDAASVAPIAGAGDHDTGAEHQRRIAELQQRWLDTQAKLLDDPREAAHEAGLLVGEAMVFVTSTFTEHRDRIERDWRDDADLGTDELLSIMRRYRSLFRSVLAASELPTERR